MKKFKKFTKRMLKNESGQGATEYILLLVVVVALVMIFKNEIKSTVEGKVGELRDSIMSFSGN